MKTVHLYYNVCDKAYMMSEQGEGWSLSPWGDNTAYYEGYTLKEGDFYLPDGYEELDDKNGHCLVLGNVICELWTEYRKPKVYHPDRWGGCFLERVAEGGQV